jgi:hypothetical protein
MKKKSFISRNHFFGIILILCAVILVWRGVWNLLDTYFFPDYPLLSNVLGILVGLILLYFPDEDLKELL